MLPRRPAGAPASTSSREGEAASVHVRAWHALFGSPAAPRYALALSAHGRGITRDVYYIPQDGDRAPDVKSGDVVFTEDPFLSRRHAALRVLSRRVAPRLRSSLVDLGSSNGTFLKTRADVESSRRAITSASASSSSASTSMGHKLGDGPVSPTMAGAPPVPATTASATERVLHPASPAHGENAVRIQLFARTDVGQVHASTTKTTSSSPT